MAQYPTFAGLERTDRQLHAPGLPRVSNCIECGVAIHEHAGERFTSIDAIDRAGDLRHYAACAGPHTQVLLGYLVDTYPEKLGMRRKRPGEDAR